MNNDQIPKISLHSLKKAKWISFTIIGLCSIPIIAFACFTISSVGGVCASAGTSVGQSTASRQCTSGGVTMTVPQFMLYLGADCMVSGVCYTTGGGNWEKTNSTTTCTAPVNRWDYQSDCSAIITPGAGTITMGPCDYEIPSGGDDCPASPIEPGDIPYLCLNGCGPKKAVPETYAFHSTFLTESAALP